MDNHEHPRIPGMNPDEKNREVFRVPEHYFEQLQEQISNKIAHQLPGKKIFGAVAFRVTIACLAGAILVTGLLLWNSKDKANYSETLVTYDQIVESTAWYDLDEQVLVDELPADFLDQVEQDHGLDEYLIDQNTDINLIINEL